MRATRGGVTLIELVVAFAIIGVIAVTAMLSIHSTPTSTPSSDFVSRITSLRDSALASGRQVTILLTVDGRTGTVTAYPDGRVLSEIGSVNRLTGRPRAER